jgi:hypothetical protein
MALGVGEGSKAALVQRQVVGLYGFAATASIQFSIAIDKDESAG